MLAKAKAVRDKLVANLEGTRAFLNMTTLGARTGLSAKLSANIGNMLFLPSNPPATTNDLTFWMIFNKTRGSLADGQPEEDLILYDLNTTTINNNVAAEAARVQAEAPAQLCARKPYELRLEYQLAAQCGR